MMTVRAADDLLVTEFGDELVILNLKDGVYYGLAGVGVHVWALVKEPTDIAAICDEITARFEVDRAECERDIRALVDALASNGLVRVVEVA